MSPLPERSSSGSLGALNLLADPRRVKFGTGHYLVCLQQWVALGWCQQWRHGKSVQFARVWSALLSLPTPPLRSHGPSHLRRAGAWVTDNPWLGCRHSAPPAATTANNANVADPVKAPSPASSFRQAIGVLHALGCPVFQKVCVCMRVFACL